MPRQEWAESQPSSSSESAHGPLISVPGTEPTSLPPRPSAQGGFPADRRCLAPSRPALRPAPLASPEGKEIKTAHPTLSTGTLRPRR